MLCPAAVAGSGRGGGRIALWRAPSAFAAVVAVLGLALSAGAVAADSGPGSVAQYVAQKRLAAQNEEPRIIGGTFADAGEWPWQVAIISTALVKDAMAHSDQAVRDQAQYRAQTCGGSFISGDWILTAAHCVVDMHEDGSWDTWAPEAIEILAGTNDLLGGKRLEVARIVVHEGYSPLTNDNDIALVKLAAAAFEGDGTATMRPVSLATVQVEAEYAGSGHAATVTGWGLTQGARIPNRLLEAEIEIQERATCNATLIEDRKPAVRFYLNKISEYTNVPIETLQDVFSVIVETSRGPITDNMICAGLVTGKKDACNGDSGGPLVVRTAGDAFVQIGIVSWGAFPVTPENDDGREVRCGYPQFFGYYTRVSKYLDWVESQVSR